ncbi:DUF397 domain-containing protein [Actinomadura algeriensis]|uniref:DUF397 domain-containing protein n=1 Tax=Actinomadura algeriensis TaxID=1679523 RepID=A0ABR9K5E5_9ACTN|nr:DUF397 domain-containing protein [Actinomadura algeriensis]MBE1537913.1 hypothetical protein [Actinomadura algeriensis]
MAKRSQPFFATSKPNWRKSHHSAQGADCIEVADIAGRCAVRDSKDPDGPRLIFSPRAWAALLTTIKAGGHDLA